MKDYKWVAVFLSSLASFFLNTISAAFSPILLLVKEDLGLTYTQSGMFTTAYFIGYTLGQIPWGYLTNRLRASRAIFLSVLGLATTTFLSSLATTGNEVIIARFFAGFLGAGIFVPGVRLLSEWFPVSNRGLAIGLFGTGTSIGGIVISFSSPFIALSFGWRWSIRALALLGFAVASALRVGLKDAPEKESASRGGESLRAVVFQRAFWILGYDQFIRLGFSYAVNAWLPTFLSENYGLGTVMASLSITLISVIGIFSNPFGGIVSDRIGETKSIAVTFAILIPSFYLLAAYSNATLVWILIALIGFFLNFLRSPLFAMLPKLFGITQSGIITGYQNTFASTGAFFFPLLIGFLRDTTASFTTGWTSLAILCIPPLISTTTLLKSNKPHPLV